MCNQLQLTSFPGDCISFPNTIGSMCITSTKLFQFPTVLLSLACVYLVTGIETSLELDSRGGLLTKIWLRRMAPRRIKAFVLL